MPSPKDIQLQAQKAPLSKADNHEVVKKTFSEEIKDIAEQLKLPDSLAKRSLATASSLVQFKREFEKLMIQANQLLHFIKDSASAIKRETKEKSSIAFENWKNVGNKSVTKSVERRPININNNINNPNTTDLFTKTVALEKQRDALEEMIDNLANEYLVGMQKEHDHYHVGHEVLCTKFIDEKNTLQQKFEAQVAQIDRETPEGAKLYDELCQQHEQAQQALQEEFHGECGHFAKHAEVRDANVEKIQVAHQEQMAPLKQALEDFQKSILDMKALMQGDKKPENSPTHNENNTYTSPSPYAKLGATPTLTKN
jgi:uncharacterized protein YjdB